MSSFEHVFLYLTLYLLCILTDVCIHKKENKITGVVILLTFCVYVFTEGLRYGRGVDYFGYGSAYLHSRSTDQPVFDWINKAVLELDLTTNGLLPYGICFIAYAVIFIGALFTLYRLFKYNTRCFLLLGCLATLYMTEWTIRQGVSMSLFLPSIYYLEKNKYRVAFLFILFSVLVHFGNTVSIVILLSCFVFFRHKPFPITLTIPLYLIIQLSVELLYPYLETYVVMLNLTALGGNFQSYIDNANRNFGEAGVQEEWRRGELTQLLTTLFYCGLIIVGYYTHKIKSFGTYIYNSFVIGIIIVEPFHLLGNVTRVFLLDSVLWFVPLSIALYNYKLIKGNYLVKVAFVFIFIYIMTYWGRYVFFNPTAKYVWNIMYY